MQSKDIFPEANKDIKILDAGAGTGIISEMLVQQGYRNIAVPWTFLKKC